MDNIKFIKIYILEYPKNIYTLSKKQHDGYEVFFSTSEGIASIEHYLDEGITFNQLPKPLLKQIK